jgi:hypothetical protein
VPGTCESPLHAEAGAIHHEVGLDDEARVWLMLLRALHPAIGDAGEMAEVIGNA